MILFGTGEKVIMSCADSNGQITMSREETTNWFGSYTMRSANGGRIAVVCRCPACLEVVEVLLLMAASSRGVDGSWKNGMREEYVDFSGTLDSLRYTIIVNNAPH